MPLPVFAGRHAGLLFEYALKVRLTGERKRIGDLAERKIRITQKPLCVAHLRFGDAGIDADNGVYINGGTVVATGNMFDHLVGEAQTYAVFTFAQQQKGGNTYTLNASKGVVLSTGGFSANGKMAQKYNTSGKWDDLSAVKTTNRYACSQGDGILMATEIGASLTDMEQIQLLYLGNLVNGQLTKYPKRVVSGTDQEIFINKEGNRFVQEDGRRDQICLASLKQTDGYFFFLESGDGSFEDLDTAISADGFTLRFLEEQGYIYVGETLDELAEKLNEAYGCTMTGEGLQATVDAFNECVRNGADPEFGRTLFTTELTKGPWVATPRQACLHHTMGGVTIDTEAHVLDNDGNVIPGLVACGEVTGGIHGGNRLGGNAVVDTVVFGKLAGETITK